MPKIEKGDALLNMTSPTRKEWVNSRILQWKKELPNVPEGVLEKEALKEWNWLLARLLTDRLGIHPFKSNYPIKQKDNFFMKRNGGWLSFKFQDGGEVQTADEVNAQETPEVSDEQVDQLMNLVINVDDDKLESVAIEMLQSDDPIITSALTTIVDKAQSGDEKAVACMEKLQPFAEQLLAMRRGGKFYHMWRLKCGGRIKKARKAQKGMPIKKAGCGCKGLRIARVGGQLVQIDCNNRIVK